MAIAKMKLVSISADKEYLNDVLLRFIELDTIHPELASKFVDSVQGSYSIHEENPTVELLTQVHDLEQQLGIQIPIRKVKDIEDISKMKEQLSEMLEHFEKIKDVKKELEIVIQENKDALVTLQRIENFDIDLDDLFQRRYIKIRFGRLPLQSKKKLPYYQNHPFAYKSLYQDDTYDWCMYVTPSKYEGDADNIFSSLYFERINIPEFVHGTPSEAKNTLSDEIEHDMQQLEHVNHVLDQYCKDCGEELSEIKSQLEFLNKTYEARKYVIGLGERFSIIGFVAKDDVASLQDTFKDLENVEIEVRPAYSDQRLTPPTKLKNGWFTRPFSMFVDMYGVVEYEGIDPTPFVAFTYSILFGLMFSDLGQGLVLVLVGYLAAKYKKMKLGEIGIRIGLFSMLFGLIFGSVFGNETLLNPMFHMLGFEEKPIEIMTSDFIPILLVTSVFIGALLIVSSISINIFLQIKNKHYGECFFGANGISGLVFYVSLLVGGVLQLVTPIHLLQNPIFVVLFLIIPIILIFLKEALESKMEHKKMFPNGFGGYFLESFFELFEIILSFITNTISYLRVGGFVLSHAGMMMAVSLIMDMAGSGSILVFIIGNALVMCLEGMIVGIQVLRLEFYEMFSRYFKGDGVAFTAMKE